MTPYYDRDGITVYNADWRDVLPTLDVVDHVITDPPYEAKTHKYGRQFLGADGPQLAPLDFAPISDSERREVGREMARLSRGWILVFCQVEAAMLWRDALVPARYVRTQIWRKLGATPQFNGDCPGVGYESIVTAWAGEGRSRWNGGGRHGVYEHLVVRGGTGHMTEKPLTLMRELVALFTNSGDIILDPYAGSLTTAVAAYQLGRRCIAIEREERWCEVGVKRLAQMPLPLEVAR